MEEFIRTKLRPTETCIVCTEPFSEIHQPIALPCHHIFGHECIKKWLREGRGNTNSCPFCRHEIYTSDSDPPLNDASIWKALCEQPPDRIHDFLTELWHRVQKLWQNRPTTTFATSDLLDKVVLASLVETADDDDDSEGDPFFDSYTLIASTWSSLGRPDQAHGVAIPLVRLVRLMSQTSSILPKWITTVPRTSVLFWNANACLGMTEQDITWTHLIEAAHLSNPRYFPLLHLYTVLISQNIVHSEPAQWPTQQDRVRAFVLERCCKKIGEGWVGRPSKGFKECLVSVYGEMRRHQGEGRRLSLRGHEEERAVVMGFWAMASWRKEDVGRSRHVAAVSPARKKASSGWDE